MKVASRYAFDSCLRTFYEGYRLFVYSIYHSDAPKLATCFQAELEAVEK